MVVVPPKDRRPSPSASTGPTAADADDIARFAAFLNDRQRREEAEAKQARQRAKEEAAARQAEVAERTREQSVRDEHAAAVAALKRARRDGRGVAEAEQRWQRASAALLELETGTRPAWGTVPETAADAAEPADDDTAEPAADEPAGDDATTG